MSRFPPLALVLLLAFGGCGSTTRVTTAPSTSTEATAPASESGAGESLEDDAPATSIETTEEVIETSEPLD